jgi:hypothetical protein
LLGNTTYFENYCWPGFSPFYSYFYQYPQNYQYAITKIYNAITTFYASMSAPGPIPSEAAGKVLDGEDYQTLAHLFVDSVGKALEYNQRVMDGGVKRRSMEELGELTTRRILRDYK